MSFPDDFTWGVATSAYQIEGGRNLDGKEDSIWDRFSHTPGKTLDGATGDTACDHYRRSQEDIGLMAELGVNAYRFSVAWTRVLNNDGVVNAAGLDFYDRLVDGLLAAGITPYLTLYHWDLPVVLEDRGGWRNRTVVDEFVRYADVVAARLGDRVKNWITINEPWVAAMVGHLDGVHAPGHRDWAEALTAGHHLLLAHGRSVPAIRAKSPDASVGIALDCRPGTPASDTADDQEAYRYFDGHRNRWFFDPVFGLGYPADMVATYRDHGHYDSDLPPFVQPGDMDEIAVPIDSLGLNYYTSSPITAGAAGPQTTERLPGVDQPAGYTEMGWPIVASGLTDFLRRIHADYGPAEIMITENGASFSDGPSSGRIADQRRIDYLRAHIDAVEDARAVGVPVTGYFVWSLMDNFEWSHAYSQRFGLVWVDFDTGNREPKDSYHWYARVIAGTAD